MIIFSDQMRVSGWGKIKPSWEKQSRVENQPKSSVISELKTAYTGGRWVFSPKKNQPYQLLIIAMEERDNNIILTYQFKSIHFCPQIIFKHKDCHLCLRLKDKTESTILKPDIWKNFLTLICKENPFNLFFQEKDFYLGINAIIKSYTVSELCRNNNNMGARIIQGPLNFCIKL